MQANATSLPKFFFDFVVCGCDLGMPVAGDYLDVWCNFAFTYALDRRH